MLKLFIATLAMVAAANVYAADATSESNQSNFMDKVYLNYFAIFHGPGITNMDEAYTPDPKTGNTIRKDNTLNTMNFDGEVTAAYLLTPTIGVGPVIPFQLYPVMGEGIVMGDAGIKAFDKAFVHTKDFNMYANMIVQLPTSTYSSSPGRGMSFGLKMTPNVRYNIPSSRFSIGAFTEEKAYFGVRSGKTLKLWAEPYVNYQLAPKLSLSLGFEMEGDHNYGSPNMDLTMLQNDLLPGVIYFITPHVMVNPYLQIFTKDKVSMDHTAVGAVVSASI